MAIGLPIISMLSGESAKIIKKHKLGLNADSGNYKELANNIIKLKKMSIIERDIMGMQCKKFAKKNYKRDNVINSFIKEISFLIKSEKYVFNKK